MIAVTTFRKRPRKTNAMDTPQQRTIKVNGKAVGLIGIDVALNQAISRDMNEQEAVDFLFAAVNSQNYIPTKAAEQYREALRLEYIRQRDQKADEEPRLTIRVLGSACIVCNKIATLAIDILQEKGLAADIESIHDLDEIWRYGVTQTPAVIINGQVKSAGFQPTRSQLEKWLVEAVEKNEGLTNC